MKFSFNLFLFIFLFLVKCPSLFSREIILITYHEEKEMAQQLKKLLVQEYQIPQEMIKMELRRSPLKQENDCLMHLGIGNGEKDFHLLVIERFFIERVVPIFFTSSKRN